MSAWLRADGARRALSEAYRVEAARLLDAAGRLDRATPGELAALPGPVPHLSRACRRLEDALDAALVAL